MTLRRKVALIFGLVLISLLVLMYGTARAILLDSFVELETRTMTQNMQRTLNVLQVEQDSLALLAARWAWWDDTYAFIQNRSAAYRLANLQPEVFANLRIDAMALLDPAGEIVYAGGYDLYQGVAADFPAALLAAVDSAPAGAASAPTVRSGYVVLPEGPWLVLVAPVLDTARAAPAQGTLIWGRQLNAQELQRLARITRLPVEIEPVTRPQLAADLQLARATLSAAAPILSRALDGSRIASYASLPDLAGAPSLLVRIIQPRDIYSRGESVVLLNLAVVAGVSVLAILGGSALFNREVLSRLLRLRDEVLAIGRSSDVSARVSVVGEDEVATVAGSVNAMLGSLEKAQDALGEAKEQLAWSARLAAAGEVAAGVAHQINNPLTTIIAELHLLKSQHTLEPDVLESVDAIGEAAYRAGTIVQQMLDLARSVPLDMLEIDVNQSVQNAIALVKAQVEPFVTRLAIALEPDLPPIKASGKHLEDVVWINLLLNARDAIRSTPNGEITVRTRFLADENQVEVSVRDNGEGITPENMTRIFSPFFTTKSYGTGLGLAICHDVIVRHHGTISVESAPGVGTTFSVRLPVTGAD